MVDLDRGDHKLRILMGFFNDLSSALIPNLSFQGNTLGPNPIHLEHEIAKTDILSSLLNF